MQNIVPPATTQVENLDLMFSWGHIRDLNMPAIAPLGEAIPNIELFRRLAGRMGLRTSASSSAMKWPLEVLDRSAPVLQGVDMDLLKRRGMPS